MNPNSKFPAKFCLVFLLGAFSLMHASAANLCGHDEKIVFACDFLSKKSVALCEGKEGRFNFLEYRYGRPSKTEMRFRADEREIEKKFHRAEVVYASNASDVVWFRSQNVVYQIHLPARGGPLLEVLNNGETISHQSCRGGWVGVHRDIDSANKYFINHGSGSIGAMERLWSEK